MKVNAINSRYFRTLYTVCINILYGNILICSALHQTKFSSHVLDYYCIYYYIFIYVIIRSFSDCKTSLFPLNILQQAYCLQVRAAAESKLQTEIDFKLTLPRNKLHPSTRYNARQPQTNALYNGSRRSLCTTRVYYYMFSALLPAYARYNTPTLLITSLRSVFTSLSLLFSLLRVSPTRNQPSTPT